jgi:hypothetical protein
MAKRSISKEQIADFINQALERVGACPPVRMIHVFPAATKKANWDATINGEHTESRECQVAFETVKSGLQVGCDLLED